ncbi:MAG: hypothetical protein KIT74_05660 [Fimbriimonadales bacterium]|nr:hypothetical protein [Fimbriimonadales bacterium]
MKGKHLEEMMIRFAYGELDGHEVTKAEELLATSDEARRIYDIYAIAAGGMKRLPEAPAPQLSSERLREAILSREIRGSGAKPWTWAGTAASIVAAGALAVYVFLPGESTVSPSDSNTVVAVRDIVDHSSSIERFEEPVSSAAVESTNDRAAETEIVADKAAPIRKRPQPAASKRTSEPTDSFTSAEVSRPAAAPGNSGELEAVVIISRTSNAIDGTSDATEIVSATDVVLGN